MNGFFSVSFSIHNFWKLVYWKINRITEIRERDALPLEKNPNYATL